MPSKVPGEKIKEHIVHTEKKREQKKEKLTTDTQNKKAESLNQTKYLFVLI